MMSKIERVLLDNPGLKGKEIAKIIREERKDVNAFLHRNTDRFSQDKNFCWFLSVPSEVRVEFEKDQWMNSDSFEKSLSKVGSPLDLECNAVIFIIPKKCNILLDAAARLLALCNQLSNAGRLVKIDFSECKSTLGYFDRIGFIDHLDMRVTVLPKRPSVSKAVFVKLVVAITTLCSLNFDDFTLRV